MDDVKRRTCLRKRSHVTAWLEEGVPSTIHERCHQDPETQQDKRETTTHETLTQSDIVFIQGPTSMHQQKEKTHTK